MANMQPLPGHPYVIYSAGPGGWSGWQIQAHCRLCGDSWSHSCNFPAKTNAWLARYGAQHAHGNQPLRQAFARQYDAELHRLHQ